MSQLPYLTKSDLPDEYEALLDPEELGEFGAVINLFRILANNPQILRSYLLWSATIWDACGLDERRRELVILTVAYERRSEYEWNQHVSLANDAGITPREMSALIDDELDQFPPEEATLIRFIRRTLSAQSNPPDTLADLREHYDDETVTGIAVLVSHYLATAYVVDALDIDLDDDFIGWDRVG